MTRRLPCPAAPGPLEGFAARFDDLFGSLAQRRGFGEYLAGLLAPRDRNKTLTALAGAEPVAGAQHAAVQRLQFFVSESGWDPGRVNARERVYYPVHAVPYTPAGHLARGRNDPEFAARLAIGADLAARAREPGFAFRAVAADCACADQDGFRAELAGSGLAFVMALKPRGGPWTGGPVPRTPVDAARDLAWGGPGDPGDWTAVTRTFGGGHARPWYAADARLGPRGPERPAPGGGHRRPCHLAARGHLVPGTWSPACPARAGPARQPARTRPPA